MKKKYIIGIDGGASKTEFVLCDCYGNVLNQVRDSSCNPNDIGMEHCVEVLIQGISRLISGYEKEEAYLYAGISGGSTGNNSEIINNKLSKQFTKIKIYNGSDAVNAVETGLRDKDGIAVIAGTGSIVYVKRNFEYKRIGGWGYLFDNGGSGYHLGREAMSAVLCEFDGTGEKTILTRLIEEKLEMSVTEALASIYIKGKKYIASFAPLVFEGFRQGDSISKEIIRRNALYLAGQISAGGRNFTEDMILVSCIGGLFRQRVFYSIIQEELDERFYLSIPELEPVFGAAREACRLAQIKNLSEFEHNFKNTVDRRR